MSGTFCPLIDPSHALCIFFFFAVLQHLEEVARIMSSAYMNIWVCLGIQWSKDSMLTRKSVGERMAPCGTPFSIDLKFETQ